MILETSTLENWVLMARHLRSIYKVIISTLIVQVQRSSWIQGQDTAEVPGIYLPVEKSPHHDIQFTTKNEMLKVTVNSTYHQTAIYF